MNARPALDVSGLPAFALDRQAPLWWGIMGIVAIEGTMFAILIASYFYLRLGVDVWPPPGVTVPGLFWPTVNVLILLLSCIPLHRSDQAAMRNDRRGMINGMLLNIALALAFVVIRIVEWGRFNYTWYSNAYGSIVWTILGLHTFDYAAAVLETVVLLAIVMAGRVGEKQRLGVHVDTLTWYFIVAAWIPLYAIIYIAPYLFRGV